MTNQNMYYPPFDYGFSPFNSTIPTQNTPNTYATSQLNDMNERINRLERQIKRLDQRLTRIETPYANLNNTHNNEPDNNMYMM